MTEYLLDTNHISPLVTSGHPLRAKILARLETDDLFSIATPALHEFLFGIRLIPRAAENLQNWGTLKAIFKYYHLDQSTAEQSARLRAVLRRQGRQLEVSAKALKRLLALQIADIMKESNMTKTLLAQRMQTSRSQLDRLLDPDNTSVTLESLEHLARAVGKQLRIEFA
jgi:predicted nucleic acid-binding protein